MQRRRLQVALDFADITNAEAFIRQIPLDAIDAIEVGTPMLTHYGVSGALEIQKLATTVPLYVDLKILDFARLELAGFEVARPSGASLLLAAAPHVQEEAVAYCASNRIQLWCSTMGVKPSNLAAEVTSACGRGVSLFIAHGSGTTLTAALLQTKLAGAVLSSLKRTWLAAGGVTPEVVPDLLEMGASGVIVGRAIAESSTPGAEVHRFRDELDRYS